VVSQRLAAAIWTRWSCALHNDVFSIRPDIADVDMHGQLQFVLNSPSAYFRISIHAVQVNISAMIKEIVGSKLGWLSLPEPKVVTL